MASDELTNATTGITRGVHKLLLHAKETHELTPNELVGAVRDLTALVDSLPGTTRNAPEAIRVVDSTKKLIAKTLILLTAKRNKKSDLSEEQAEFQRRIVNFRSDFKDFLAWKERPHVVPQRPHLLHAFTSASPVVAHRPLPQSAVSHASAPRIFTPLSPSLNNPTVRELLPTGSGQIERPVDHYVARVSTAHARLMDAEKRKREAEIKQMEVERARQRELVELDLREAELRMEGATGGEQINEEARRMQATLEEKYRQKMEVLREKERRMREEAEERARVMEEKATEMERRLREAEERAEREVRDRALELEEKARRAEEEARRVREKAEEAERVAAERQHKLLQIEQEMKQRTQMAEKMKSEYEKERKAREADERKKQEERERTMRDNEDRKEAQRMVQMEKERAAREEAARWAEEERERVALEKLQRELDEQRCIKERAEKERKELEEEAERRARSAQEAETMAEEAEFERIKAAEEAEERARKAEERAMELELAALEAERLAEDAERAAQAAIAMEELLMGSIDESELDEIIERERVLEAEHMMLDTFAGVSDGDDLSTDIDAELAELEAEGMRRYHAKLNADTKDILELVTSELEEGNKLEKVEEKKEKIANPRFSVYTMKEIEDRRKRLQWLPATKAGLVDAIATVNQPQKQIARSSGSLREGLRPSARSSVVDDDALFDMIDDALVDDVKGKLKK